MGQYYKIVNLDKREYLHPHKCGDGLKLMEFGLSGDGTMACLAILLADGNGRGGGDLDSNHPIIGSWAGDRIVITGDYADEGKFVDTPDANLYAALTDNPNYTDVSEKAIAALGDDEYFKETWEEKVKNDFILRGVYGKPE
jgi:hypothetical protein